MSQSLPVLPAELLEELERARCMEAQGVLRAIDSLWKRRHPELLTRDNNSYRVPTSIALTFYSRDAKRFRELAAVALGPEGSVGYWQRLGAIARAAFHAGDWELLGSLAYRVDLATAPAALVPPSHSNGSAGTQPDLIEDASGVEGTPFVDAFLKTFDLQHLGPREFAQGALRYMEALPKSFILPRELLEGDLFPAESVSQGNGPLGPWALLRHFWKAPAHVWSSWPAALEALARCRSPFVHVLADELVEKANATNPPKPSKRRKHRANPFSSWTAPDSAEPESRQQQGGVAPHGKASFTSAPHPPDRHGLEAPPRSGPDPLSALAAWRRKLAANAATAWSQRFRRKDKPK